MKRGDTIKPWVPGSRIDSHFQYFEESNAFHGSIQTDDFIINVGIYQAGPLSSGNYYKITTPTYRTDGPPDETTGIARMVQREDGSKYLAARLDIELYEEPIYCRIEHVVTERTSDDPQNISHLYDWVLTEDMERTDTAPVSPKWEKIKDFFHDAKSYAFDLMPGRSPERGADMDMEP